MRDFFNKYKFYILLLVYWPFHFLWYSVSMHLYPDSEVWLVHIPLDDLIVFCEWFVIPYVLWYFYIVAVMVNGFKQGKREFARADLLLMGCMFIPMLFCTIVPNGISLDMRPDFETLGRDNFAITLVKAIYAVDTPARNVMPSMHASVSVALAFAVWQTKTLKDKAIVKILLTLLSVSVIFATTFIKQHSALDAIVGTLLGIAVGVAVKIGENIYDKKKSGC